jgi:hypothetical protein
VPPCSCIGLPALYRGCYFFADFVTRKVWSLALTVNPSTGTATAADLRDHTQELGAPEVTSFGVDAAGELYFTSYTAGTISRVTAADGPAPNGLLTIEDPPAGARVGQPFLIRGWALDVSSIDSPGIDVIHIWAFPSSGAGPRFLGTAWLGLERPDSANTFGSQFAGSGFTLFASGLPAGPCRLFAIGLVHATGAFSLVQTLDVTMVGGRQE